MSFRDDLEKSMLIHKTEEDKNIEARICLVLFDMYIGRISSGHDWRSYFANLSESIHLKTVKETIEDYVQGNTDHETTSGILTGLRREAVNYFKQQGYDPNKLSHEEAARWQRVEALLGIGTEGLPKLSELTEEPIGPERN